MASINSQSPILKALNAQHRRWQHSHMHVYSCMGSVILCNSLPLHAVMASSLVAFKRELDKFQEVKSLTSYGSSRICATSLFYMSNSEEGTRMQASCEIRKLD